MINCLCDPYPQTLGLILGPVNLAAVRENDLTAIDFPPIHVGIHSVQFVLCFRHILKDNWKQPQLRSQSLKSALDFQLLAHLLHSIP